MIKREWNYHEDLLQIAATNGDQVLVLGAFGCGAFQNKPETLAGIVFQKLADGDILEKSP